MRWAAIRRCDRRGPPPRDIDSSISHTVMAATATKAEPRKRLPVVGSISKWYSDSRISDEQKFDQTPASFIKTGSAPLIFLNHFRHLARWRKMHALRRHNAFIRIC